MTTHRAAGGVLDIIEDKFRIGNLEEILPPSPGEVLDFVGLPTLLDLPTPQQVADGVVPKP